MRLLAEFCFSGDNPESDPDLAVELVRAAGYQVFKISRSLRAELTLGHPLDDFCEAVTDAPGSGFVDNSRSEMTPQAHKLACAIMDEINALVHRHGGSCHTCGAIGDNGEFIPFADQLRTIAERRYRNEMAGTGDVHRRLAGN
jgi:hypothetical protein